MKNEQTSKRQSPLATERCLRTGACNLIFVWIAAAVAGCAVAATNSDEGQDTQAAVVAQSFPTFVLTVSGFEAGIHVTSTGISDSCPADSTCDFPFFAGTAVSISPDFTKDTVDCLQFANWQEACAGQRNPCNLVINSDLSVSEKLWVRLSGCIPQ
jgi:hypothetical protein